MNPDRPQAIQYLRAPASQLWRWTDGGTVVIWRDGTTLAFREEIMAILEWLGPQGLPSFGSLVFLLAATRGKIPALADVLRLRQELFPSLSDTQSMVLSVSRQQLKLQLIKALEDIRLLAELPVELRTGLPARCLLAEAVFEHARAERHTEAALVLRGWSEPIPDDELNASRQTDDTGITIRQIHVVAEGCRRQTPESLGLRLRTGLEALPKKADLTLPPAEQARRLIEELSRDPARGAVARAARGLMAAIRLPRHLGEREELAIGGVADLTNRGALDRLLLSELAHDDLTLAVRIALNEALFLRREPPQQEPPGTLGLLLDSGIRLWGVPRVLAAAAGLALAASHHRHTRVLAWRARGREVHPVDLLTRGGLIQHLESLETTAHPGDALAAFVAAQPSEGANQIVVITHRDALQDPEFREQLTEQLDGGGFVATVDRFGAFELHLLPLAQRPPRCAAQLDLTEIFETKQPSATPMLNPALAAKLPAIFAVRPFPLLLPFSGSADHWARTAEQEICAVLPDRLLIRFLNEHRGGVVLAGRLPPGKTHWLACVGPAVQLVKGGTSQRQVRLVTVPLEGGSPRSVDLLDASEILAVHRVGEVLILIRAQDIRAFSLVDGRPLGSLVSPHPWLHGRFFASPSKFHCATWDGSGVRLEPLTLPSNFSPAVILKVFDREGVEGPWVVHRGGQIISCATGEAHKVTLPAGVSYGVEKVCVSANGHSVLLSMANPDWSRLVDLNSGETITITPNTMTQSDLDVPPRLPHWRVFRVRHLIAFHGNMLCFRGRKSRWRAIDLEGEGDIKIKELPTTMGGPEVGALSFNGYPIPAELGCSLQVATWPNGSQAFLDSRGLLHLKSSQPSVREVTLALAEGSVAGWVSGEGGAMCGPAFFLHDPDAAQPSVVRQAIRDFLRHL